MTIQTLQKTQLITCQHLTQDVLKELLRGNILSIRIPNFYPANLCKKPSERITDCHDYYSISGAGNVGRLGMSFSEIQNNSEAFQKYYSQSFDYICQVREMFNPYLSPIDQLRLQLQEVWDHGANLENIDSQTMNIGLARVFKENAEALPHQDVLSWDAPHAIRAYEHLNQLAANIYLQTSEGGEIELWNRKLSKQEYDTLRTPNSYDVNRRFLGSPDLTIKPEIGDLILFQSTCLHAVRKVTKGFRVTLSCFIGYRGDDQPLSYWS